MNSNQEIGPALIKTINSKAVVLSDEVLGSLSRLGVVTLHSLTSLLTETVKSLRETFKQSLLKHYIAWLQLHHQTSGKTLQTKKERYKQFLDPRHPLHEHIAQSPRLHSRKKSIKILPIEKHRHSNQTIKTKWTFPVFR